MSHPDRHNNIRLTIAYDGTAYRGWQKTPTGPSIEEALQRAVEQILQHPVELQAASRTDAGVHAEGQVVNFMTHKTGLDFDKLRYGINALLPKDIVVLTVAPAAEAFHPTLDAKGKEYHYSLCIGAVQQPRHRYTSWHWPFPLDTTAMEDAAKRLIGTHDFAALCNVRKNQQYESTIRTVESISLTVDLDRLHIAIIGDHFLYKMVRNIVGLLVTAGAGKIHPSDIRAILDSKDRRKAPLTAPAHGLTLHRVFYEEKS